MLVSTMWLRNRHVGGASVTSGRRLACAQGRIAPFYAPSTGAVCHQAGNSIAAADVTPDAPKGMGPIGVRDWSPPA